MTHLKIEQNGIIEDVSIAILNKIYELSQQTLDNSSSLRGELRVPKYYRTKAQEIQERWNNLLHVTATEWYIDFADSTVEQICATNWGDGNGITESQAAIVDIGTTFARNTNIISFDELGKFTATRALNQEAFAGCTKLKSIDLSGITGDIRQSAFQDCSLLEEVNLPNANHYLYNKVFQNCSSIKKVTIGSLIAILNNVFQGCTSLKEIVLPSTLDQIGVGAFYGCTALEEVDLTTTSVTALGSQTYWNCSNLKSLGTEQLDQITAIGYSSLHGCSSLEGQLIFKNLTSLDHSNYGGWFAGCSKITKILLGHISSLYSGSNYIVQDRVGFYRCTSLRTLDLGDSIVRIGNKNFLSAGTTALEALVIRTTTPPKGCNDQGGNISDNDIPLYFPSLNYLAGNTTAYIYVPDAAVQTYKDDVLFGMFADRIKPISEYEAAVAVGTLI